MSVILGIGPPATHDPAAALLVDGRLVAAVEEERFLREKHARDRLPLHAIRYCLQAAGLSPSDVEHVTFAWCPAACHRAKWHYAADLLGTSLHHARKVLTKARKINQVKARIVQETIAQAGLSPRVRVHYVEHHLAHAASAAFFSGFGDTAFMSIDGSGEMITALFGEVRDGRFRKFKEVYNPNSLGLFYSTVTEYLGFESNDGEYKLMGMAPFGDPSKADVSCMIREADGAFKVDNDYVWVIEPKRHRPGVMYSSKMVERFGPPRTGDGLGEPYVHIAAATQQRFEQLAVRMVERHLAEPLRRHGRLCVAGGCALNVILNKQLLLHPLIKQLFVPPAANDAGTPLGSAAVVAHELGEPTQPMVTAAWGPEYAADEITAALAAANVRYERISDPAETAAELVARGDVVGWFQGRMEYGPRALGNRSILGHPAKAGTKDKINAIVKFREIWRPFCPSVLAEDAPEIFEPSQDAPFMTIAFPVREAWRSKIPEVVHVDGTARAQTVTAAGNPLYHRMLQAFKRRTGLPVIMNTSLNRRGEPIVCAPADAVAMFLGSGLDYLCIGDFLASKR